MDDENPRYTKGQCERQIVISQLFDCKSPCSQRTLSWPGVGRKYCDKRSGESGSSCPAASIKLSSDGCPTASATLMYSCCNEMSWVSTSRMLRLDMLVQDTRSLSSSWTMFTVTTIVFLFFCRAASRRARSSWCRSGGRCCKLRQVTEVIVSDSSTPSVRCSKPRWVIRLKLKSSSTKLENFKAPASKSTPASSIWLSRRCSSLKGMPLEIAAAKPAAPPLEIRLHWRSRDRRRRFEANPCANNFAPSSANEFCPKSSLVKCALAVKRTAKSTAPPGPILFLVIDVCKRRFFWSASAKSPAPRSPMWLSFSRKVMTEEFWPKAKATCIDPWSPIWFSQACKVVHWSSFRALTSSLKL